MFVCVCHGITDKEIKAAIVAGHDNLAALMEKTEAATQCGSCLDDVSALLSAHKQIQSSEVAHLGLLSPSLGEPQIYGLAKVA